MPTTDTLIGTAEAARILSKTPRTVQRMVASGVLIPAVTLPGATGAHLFNKADVEALSADTEDGAA